MKRMKIFKLLGIAVVLSLLLLTVPALPAMAISTSLSPTSGKIGDNIDVLGDAFTSYKSTPTYEAFAEIYLAEENVIIGKSIDTDVKTYKWVAESELAIDATTGDFTATFNVPSRLDDYAVTSYHDDVRVGTYYIYITINKYYLDGVTEPEFGKIIRSKATFTVTASAALNPLTIASGPAGTQIPISGANFPAGTIAIRFDSTPLTVTGSTQTSGGSFSSFVTIPAGASPGNHTITVTVSTTSVSTTFNVTASAALDPLSPATGAAGTEVIVSGANFPAGTALVFRFDTTTLTPKAGTDASTRSSGIFISTITIPSSATAGAHNITATAGAGSATATFTVTAVAALEPLSPVTGAAGTDVVVSGANFMASYPIIFKLDSTTLTPKSGDSNTTTGGSFFSIITIPAGTASGGHTISVTVGTVTLTATFTVTGGATATPTPPPSQTSVNVVQNDYFVGAPLGIAGVGFSPGATVTIKYAGDTKATAQVEANSTFQVIFEMPALKLGARQFTISDGVHTTTANFTVETTAPPVPSLISPETGVEVEIPITFTWGSVTDASSPVTYNFQIATDETFSAGSIVLEKKALDKAEFMLTEADGLEPTEEEAPYYWRIKAIDGALNESAWTSALDFITSGPSEFPRWAIILIGVFGGLFVFGLGYWLGRRTAFNY